MPKITLTDDMLWRGTLYPAGAATIPDDLAEALGLGEDEPTRIEPSSTPAEGSQALALINNSDAPEDITPIKGIGIGGARKLLERRPDGGYESLEQAAAMSPELARAPFNVQWEQVAQWRI